MRRRELSDEKMNKEYHRLLFEEEDVREHLIDEEEKQEDGNQALTWRQKKLLDDEDFQKFLRD